MKISVNLFMALNGIRQAPGAPDEDTRGGFIDGGWFFTTWDDGCAAAADLINTRQKYVVTSAALGNVWSESSTVLRDDFLDEITQLKELESDLELQVHGRVQLARTLHQAGLVDIYRFLVSPVVVAPGTGIFESGGPSYKMNVRHSAVTQNGVLDVEMTPETLDITQTATVQDGKDVLENV